MTNPVKRLAEHLDEAQLALEELRRTCGCDAFPPIDFKPQRRHQTALEAAQMAYEQRQSRNKIFFDNDLFGEPAWDILLDLYIHQARNESVFVKSACIGSGASATTALRWIQVLETKGLLCSAEDPTDSRRRLLRLTAEGYECMTRYLEGTATSVDT